MAGHSRQLAERGLAAGINLVATNPAAFGDALASGNRLVDSLGLAGDVREDLRRSHQNLLTKAVFENRIYSARSVAEVDTVLTDLARPEWRERANPATFDNLLDQARTYRRTLAGSVDTATRVAIDMLQGRMEASPPAAIDPTEIARVDQLVSGSQDLGIRWRWAQMRARYDVSRVGHRATPDALAAAINDTVAAIGLPPAVGSAVEAASRSTNGQVSAGYLSQLALSQSGDYLRGQRRARPEFALQSAHAMVNLQHVTREVQDAGAVAGEIFGAPLRITSGHRDPFRNYMVGGASGSRHLHGNAIDVDTSGMDAATRGRLVDALVQAGFTGFGQYGAHIHADMRPAVATGFGTRPGYGGWTQLDPEVMAVLERRGFTAGRAAAELNRTGTGTARPSTSPETGVFGFDNATWLGLASRHGEALGVTTGMVEADILRLRQNPATAARVAALYASENRVELQAGLGREVSDAELAIAHRIGPAAALVMLRRMQDAPQTPTRDAMPEAVARNPELLAGTVGEAYTRMLEGFTGGVSALQHVRLTALQTVQQQQTAARSGDIMTYAGRAGHVQLADLQTDGDFENRGRQALQVQQMFRLESPSPLTADEVDRFTNVIRTGTVADASGLLTSLQRLGPRAAAGAYRQLGQSNETFAHVAGLSTQGEAHAVTAREVLRGLVRIRDNPDVKQIFTTAHGGADNQFNLVVGGALDSADPRQRQAIRLAADAYYIERFASGQTTFNPRDYALAVQAVLGGRGGAGGIGQVNGVPVLLPQGITASQFDRALDGLAASDLATLSVGGQAPRQRDGRPVSVTDIAYEGRFRATGNNTYSIVMADGLPLWTEAGQPYQVTLTPQTIRDLSTRQPEVPDRDIPRLGR